MAEPENFSESCNDEFCNSRRLVWFNNIAVVVLCLISIFVMKSEAMPILVIAIPSMLGLVGHWSHTVNKNNVS